MVYQSTVDTATYSNRAPAGSTYAAFVAAALMAPPLAG